MRERVKEHIKSSFFFLPLLEKLGARNSKDSTNIHRFFVRGSSFVFFVVSLFFFNERLSQVKKIEPLSRQRQENKEKDKGFLKRESARRNELFYKQLMRTPSSSPL